MKKFSFFSFAMLFLLSITSIAQIPPKCIPSTVSSSSSYISSVRLGSINNPSTGIAGGYSDYRYLSTTVAIGSSNTITVKSTNPNGLESYWSIYIDYNRNGILSDAGELVASGHIAAGNSISLTFTPPATAFNGPTTLRVQMTQSGSAPCVTYYDYGEKEDYTVNITGGFCYSHGVVSTSDYISNVSLGGMSKTSGNDGGYANYTSSSANLTSGFTCPVSLSRLPLSGRTEYWTVFIDYNNNKSFADAGELVALVSGTNVSNADIHIPQLITSMTGTVRLRVIMSHTGYKTNPCDTVSNGEVEDYSANLLPPVLGTAKTSQAVQSLHGNEASVSVQPNPGTASNTVVRYSVAAAGTVNIRITDLSGRSVLVYHAGNKTAGVYTYALSSSYHLSAGTYLLLIEQNGQSIAHDKFILVP